MTWSRPGLIGVTARAFIANRFICSKAAKLAPSCITLIHLCDWLAIDLGDADVWEITGGELTLRTSSLTSIALQKALKALADVTAHCDGVFRSFSIHCQAVPYLHKSRPNAVDSGVHRHCVSGRCICDLAIMLSCILPNGSRTPVPRQ